MNPNYNSYYQSYFLFLTLLRYFINDFKTAFEEIEFINSIIQESDCELLVDINNIYVNSINHNYDIVENYASPPSRKENAFASARALC